MQKLMSVALLLALAATSACKKDEGAAAPVEKKEAPKVEPKTVFTCKLQVAKKVTGDFSGDATGADEKATLEAAWTAVCAKLPEGDRPSCRDQSKFQSTQSGGSATAGKKTTYTVTIKLVPVATAFDGAGKSEANEDEACKQANAEACKAAGETGDCVAGGAYEAKNIMKSSEKTTVGM